MNLNGLNLSEGMGKYLWGRIIEANQANESQFIIDASQRTWLAIISRGIPDQKKRRREGYKGKCPRVQV
jgi:hypothetical protein